MLHSRVAARHTDDLVVPASLVGHPEHPDRPAVDQTAGKSRLLDQHQRVERITVLAEGLLDEAVVRRVPGRGKEHPVQPDPVGVVIHLVLVALPLRDLDRDVEMHLSSFRSRADGMQRLPSALVSPKRRQPVRRAPCIRKMTNLGGRGVRASRPILPASLAALVVVVAVGAVAVRHNRDAQRTTARSAAVRSPAAVPAPSPPPLLLPEVTDGHPAPTPAGLAAALAPPLADPALGSHVAATVVDAVGAGPPPGYPPAPSLGNRAAAGAGAGVTRVSRVVVDAGLFAEPRTAPGWRPMYVALGNVAPVTALMVDGGRSRPDRDPRDPDPDLLAGRALLAALGQRGVAVSGATVARGSALPQSRELAAVSSAPVPALVERMLRTSDNDVAEALTRHIALRLGAPATFAGGVEAIRRAVAPLGVPAGAVALVDGSGLSRDDRLAPSTVVRLLVLAAAPDHPELRPLLTGLPVAGFAGTLADRFRTGPSAPAAGVVRAKTGTLEDVSALAGVVVDADGRLLAFNITADAVPVGRVSPAEAALDRTAAVLAGCGCR